MQPEILGVGCGQTESDTAIRCMSGDKIGWANIVREARPAVSKMNFMAGRQIGMASRAWKYNK
jgi:hypothetical protein